jgi:hypothetical protein
VIPNSWLITRVASTDLEAVQDREIRALGLSGPDQERLLVQGMSPMWKDKWQHFLAQMIAGDELWAFESPPESWPSLSGAPRLRHCSQWRPRCYAAY